MNLLQEIDFDKASMAINRDVAEAIAAWLRGAPTSESALTNRITEALARRRRQCDVGVHPETSVRVEHFMLDRQGRAQQDLFGADLAVTVHVNTPTGSMIKTALIQFKVSDHYRIGLERRQLMDALINSQTADRAFVIAVDRRERGNIRVRMTSEVLKLIPPNAKSHTFDTEGWMPLTHWLFEWLSCHVGVPSTDLGPNGIESQLARMFPGPPGIEITAEEVLAQIEGERLLARQWIHYFITSGRSADRLPP